MPPEFETQVGNRGIEKELGETGFRDTITKIKNVIINFLNKFIILKMLLYEISSYNISS